MAESKALIQSKNQTVDPAISRADAYRQKMGELIRLPKDVERKLKNWLNARIKEWEEDTADLHRRLQEDNDLVEGIVPDTDFPWAGACNTHLPIPETHMKIYRGTLRRSTMGGSNDLWMAEADPEILEQNPGIGEIVPKIAQGLNWLAKNKWNILTCLKGIYWTTPRDRLGIMQITWDEAYSKGTDIVMVAGLQEFVQQFPDPETSGIPEEEYIEWFEKARVATPEAPLEIPITVEKCDYYGCKGDVVELVDFVTIPSAVPDIRHESCVGYGKRFRERRGIIKKKGKNGKYFDDIVEKLVKKSKASGGKPPEFQGAQEEISGIRRGKAYEIENMELVVKLDLSSFGMKEEDGQGSGEMKYLITYNKEHNELLEFRPYPYRVDDMATFKIDDVPNQLLGRNIPDMTRQLSELIDATTRQRVNSRTISHVPTFIGDSTKKKEFEQNNPDPSFFPGKGYWVPGGSLSYDQMKIQPTDMGEVMADEQNWARLLEIYTGANITLASGQAQTGDPNAPGNKTAMMIQQGNLRMEEPLDTMREGIDQVGEICKSHLYQFGPAQIPYMQTDESGKNIPAVFSKQFLRVGVRVKMSGITVTDNPDSEMAKWINLHIQLMQFYAPYAQNPEAQTFLLRHALSVGNVAIKDKILPTIATIQQQQIEMQKKAMLQMMLEKAQAEKQAQVQTVKDNLAGARQELAIKATAEKMAEVGMGGLNGRG